MNDNDTIVLLEYPRITADFGKLTVGDVIKLTQDSNYFFTLLGKCVVEDVDSISIDHLPAIIQAFGNEYQRFFDDAKAVRELINAT
jgi:hypothetical protein